MTLCVFRRCAQTWVPSLCALLMPAAGSAACEPDALLAALSRVSVQAPRAIAQTFPDARPLQSAELSGLPALARIESLLRSVGIPWAWHRLDPDGLAPALQAGGGTLIVARAGAEGDPQCEVLTPTQSALGTVRSGESQRPVQARPVTLLALLPARDAGVSEPVPSLHEGVVGMLADFRLAMRVGGQYAPKDAWVVSPWVSVATLQRSADLPSPFLPGLRGRADTRVRATSAGFGLTRGLTRDTSVTLLMTQQRSDLGTSGSFPAFGSVPEQRFNSVDRQEDTLAGLGLYSLLVREQGAVPAVLLNARVLAPSTHSRTAGHATLTSLYQLESGWAVAASVGADAERPEAAASRQTRYVTLGASAQLSERWMVTADAGQRELRGVPGTQSLQRLRLYRSFGSMAYLALVIDREADDRRTTLTFARPL